MSARIDRPSSPSLSSTGMQPVSADVGQSSPTPRAPTGALAGLQSRDSTRLSSSSAPRAALPAKAPEKTAAGHAESFARLGPSHIAKMTSAQEAGIYQRFGQQLQGAIPDTVPVAQAAQLQGVSADQSAALQRLNAKAAQTGQQVVIMAAVGGNIPKEDKRELDIKIGASTASRTELEDAGASSGAARLKKAKMTVADLARGSRSLVGEDRGYSLTGRTVHGDNPDPSRFSAGRASNPNIQEMLNVPEGKGPEVAGHLLTQLEGIRTKMQATDVTFVASSILIAIDEKNPQNSVAKLIDLAHPVEKGVGSADYEKLDKQFDHGLSQLIQLVKQSATPAATPATTTTPAASTTPATPGV
ncbi:inositol polyphosphate kinase family protein [Roseateles noduli]|jgi:filamentous hemagglutinin|uniref:inositol polyphosphate kinase family protein n=1 Tax=Roseateles noduli TaxID=2052484 RepID=UPI003D6458E0